MILERNQSRQASLIIQNFKNVITALSYSQKEYHNSQYFFSKIPHPMFNCVIDAVATDNNIEKTISHIWEDYQKNNTPHCWWISDFSEPKNFSKYLEHLSFIKCPPYSGMHANLQKIDIDLKTSPKIRIEKISQIEDLDEWVKPLALSFEFSNDVTQTFTQCYKDLFVTKMQLISYVAYYEDNLAGCSTLFLDKDAAGLYNGAVFPQFRNKGILTMLGNTMLLEAKNQGYEDVVMQVSQMIHNVSIKAGFKEYLQLQAYLSP